MTIYVRVAVLRAARNALAGRSLPTPVLATKWSRWACQCISWKVVSQKEDERITAKRVSAQWTLIVD